MRLTLPAPQGFSFRQTVRSHGWAMLAPFRLDERATVLDGVVGRPGGGAVAYRLSAGAGKVLVEAPGRGDAPTRRLLRATARRVLNLDLDLSGFYDAVRGVDDMAWMAEVGAGRMLRSPTVFEDLVKLVLTTNCTWALTTRMVSALVERHGEAAPDGSRAFPTPEAMARAGTRGLRTGCRTGYRAPALARIARDVAADRLDPESWPHDEREATELRRAMLELPGVGPYVAESLLRLLGRPAGLGLDSSLRTWYARVYHGGRPVADRTIARRFKSLGRWAGLAAWCQMTRDWLVEDGPAPE
jgi:N-glycosylase/DNA lyase